MEKITRKEFENVLTNKESYFIASNFTRLDIEKILELIKEKENAFLENKNKFELRKGILRSNAIVFEKVNNANGKSWLFLSSGNKYYKYNDFIISHNQNVNFTIYLLNQ
jgi:hypothetical protein